jgi:hypothetical protein
MISRAWHVLGSSIRCAQFLALHLVNDTPGTSDAQVELEVRIWHSISSLETFICFLTGRPAAIQYRYDGARLPAQFENNTTLQLPRPPGSKQSGPSNQAGSSTMVTLRASIQLNKILSEAMGYLYSAGTARRPWSDIQTAISQLNTRLANWRSALPPMLLLDPDTGGEKSPLPERMYFQLRYFSTRMMINRPCLFDLHQKNTIPSQSTASKQDDRDSARLCVSSARGLIRLFPDEPDIIALYRSTPWWCVLHYIVQAGAVLVLEIGFNASHVSDEMDILIQDACKVLKWLQKLSNTTLSAYRAWIAMSRILSLSMLRVGRSTAYIAHLLPSSTSVPPSDQMGGLGPIY